MVTHSASCKASAVDLPLDSASAANACYTAVPCTSTREGASRRARESRHDDLHRVRSRSENSEHCAPRGPDALADVRWLAREGQHILKQLGNDPREFEFKILQLIPSTSGTAV